MGTEADKDAKTDQKRTIYEKGDRGTHRRKDQEIQRQKKIDRTEHQIES